MSGVLLIDPYANPGIARADLAVMNRAADHLVDEYDADPDKVIQAIKSAHRPGMAALALITHALRALGIKP